MFTRADYPHQPPSGKEKKAGPKNVQQAYPGQGFQNSQKNKVFRSGTPAPDKRYSITSPPNEQHSKRLLGHPGNNPIKRLLQLLTSSRKTKPQSILSMLPKRIPRHHTNPSLLQHPQSQIRPIHMRWQRWKRKKRT